MMRCTLLLLFVLLARSTSAQFPFHRTIEVRPGQEQLSLTSVAQDTVGLLWVGSDIGLLRTDGEQVDVVLRTEGARVTALAPLGHGAVVALSDGRVLRCELERCDTLLMDTVLAERPVRSILLLPDGKMVLATYGAGLWTLSGSTITRLGITNGLPDDHVNGAAVLPDGRIVAATDQGLAVCVGGAVVEVFDGSNGAPDNLILSVAVDASGIVHAGTDGRGAFSWRPGSTTAVLVDAAWDSGPVISILVQNGQIWTGTERHGVELFGLGEDGSRYRQHAEPGSSLGSAMSLFADREGAVWWCDGSHWIHRADPAVLFVPVHEGTDMRAITALCVDRADRIWFATPDGLFHHSSAFSEAERVTRIPLTIDPRTPIVSLAACDNGSVWAATFGNGVLRIAPSGTVQHFGRAAGLGNDNVLSVRSNGDTVWFATLDGITRWDGARFQQVAGTSGFTFDVLPMPGGRALVATDGRGIVAWGGGEVLALPSAARTYYSLVRDDDGGAWTCGPGTGLCNIGERGIACVGAGRSPFDGDLFALGWSNGHAIAFGSTGTVALDPHSGRWTDLTARLGLEGIQAQLNVIAPDQHGVLWFACDRGLVRFRSRREHFDPDVPLLITELVVNGERVPPDGPISTAYDRNDIAVRFTGLYYADPSALRFEHRLNEGRSIRTRDRELALAGLPPGTHALHIRAFVGEPGPSSPWRTIIIQVVAPWWQRPSIVIPLVLALASLAYLLVRARERRLHERDRAEQEKVRFQLEALRSQVDPHFLFNSFNTLIALIETDRDKAVEHVEELSTFFRNMLVVRDTDLIPLNKELELLQSYFGLEQRRFGNAIDLFVNIDEGAYGSLIVPLTLQLVVENALKHNTATLQEPLHVHIAVEGDVLVVRNAIRPRASSARSTGFGLDSITKRYQALTPRKVEVTRDNATFIVRIPLLPPDEHPDR